MPTIAKQLEQLQNDKQNIVNTLISKKVNATNSDTFTTLAVKLADMKFQPTNISFANAKGDLTYELTNTNFDNLSTFERLFYNCDGVVNPDLTPLVNAKPTSMREMFNGCSSLDTLDLRGLDTSNVTTMYALAQSSSARIIKMNGLDTSKVTTFQYAFYYCQSLTSLDMSDCDFSNVVDVSSMFYWNNNVVTLLWGKNYGKGFTQKTKNYSKYTISLSALSDKLSRDSLVYLINNLYDLNLTYDVANGGTLYTQQISLDSGQLSKLTEEEIALAANKGWILT